MSSHSDMVEYFHEFSERTHKHNTMSVEVEENDEYYGKRCSELFYYRMPIAWKLEGDFAYRENYGNCLTVRTKQALGKVGAIQEDSWVRRCFDVPRSQVTLTQRDWYQENQDHQDKKLVFRTFARDHQGNELIHVNLQEIFRILNPKLSTYYLSKSYWLLTKDFDACSRRNTLTSFLLRFDLNKTQHFLKVLDSLDHFEIIPGAFLVPQPAYNDKGPGEIEQISARIESDEHVMWTPLREELNFDRGEGKIIKKDDDPIFIDRRRCSLRQFTPGAQIEGSMFWDKKPKSKYRWYRVYGWKPRMYSYWHMTHEHIKYPTHQYSLWNDHTSCLYDGRTSFEQKIEENYYKRGGSFCFTPTYHDKIVELSRILFQSDITHSERELLLSKIARSEAPRENLLNDLNLARWKNDPFRSNTVCSRQLNWDKVYKALVAFSARNSARELLLTYNVSRLGQYKSVDLVKERERLSTC